MKTRTVWRFDFFSREDFLLCVDWEADAEISGEAAVEIKAFAFEAVIRGSGAVAGLEGETG